MENQFTTPILFIIFNRPDTTREVFEAIRKIRPTKLYIAADGPRAYKTGEGLISKETREITEKIDWPCEVFRKYSDTNLGCKTGVSSAITWFFENVEQGIILEDDCLPDPTFFPFCGTMLEKYKDVDEIKMISGDNFHFGKKYGDASYYFSHFQNIWGWATWRRVWETYDGDMKDMEEYFASKEFNTLFKNKKILEYWKSHLRHVRDKKIDTWDAQWSYAIIKKSGITIIPNVNLISNIGFGEAATHTTKVDPLLSRIPSEKLETIIHPSSIVVNEEADEQLFYTLFYRSFFSKVISKIKSLIGA